jgi:uncharacterized protein
LYALAAERGVPSAQSNLASLYFTGRGVKRDYGHAAFWAQKAAESGLPIAQSNLAYLYSTGRGVHGEFLNVV